MTSDQTSETAPLGGNAQSTEARLRALLRQGEVAARSGRRDRAQRCFEAVLDIDPDNERAWLWLAAMTRDPQLARTMYRRVLEVHPVSEDARKALLALEQQQAAVPLPSEQVAGQLPAESESPAPPAESSPLPSEPAVAVPQPSGPELFVPPWEQATVDATGEAATLVPVPDPAALPEPETGASGSAAVLSPPVEATSPEQADVPQPVSERPVPDSSTPEIAPDMSPQATIVEPLRHRLAGTLRSLRVRNALMIIMLVFVLLGAVLLIILLSRRILPVGATEGGVQQTLVLPTATLVPVATWTPLPTVFVSPTSLPAGLAGTDTLAGGPVPGPTASLSPTVVISPTALPKPAWATQRYLPLPWGEKWIEVDLARQKLFAYEGTRVVFSATISSGTKSTPTIEGKFRIVRKLESQDMIGANYVQPNVPYVMYFYGGYALHGAYWHNNWGTPVSHGCVNLRREDAKWLYDWTDPKVPPKAKLAVATNTTPGTWVLVHH